jgi:4-methyl-5(b-hydroxyethyl)-thiazole monophosphate biosynthesis
MNVLVPIAHGSESLETITIVNLLRRAQFEVVVASIEIGLVVRGTRAIPLTASALLEDVAAQNFDLIALPGGEEGAKALGRNDTLVHKLHRQRFDKRPYAAICAAPAFVLAPNQLLDGMRATCYPAFREQLSQYVDEPVVVDGLCTTSQGPATAIAFTLSLIEGLAGAEKRDAVAKALLAA